MSPVVAHRDRGQGAEFTSAFADVRLWTALAGHDAVAQERIGLFLQGLHQAGWTIGQNLRVDTRWVPGGAEDIRKYAAELVGLSPDVILATGSPTLGPLLQLTRTVPIVFVSVPDPVGAGFVESLPDSDLPRCPLKRRCWGTSGLVVLIPSFVGYDPTPAVRRPFRIAIKAEILTKRNGLSTLPASRPDYEIAEISKKGGGPCRRQALTFTRTRFPSRCDQSRALAPLLGRHE